MHSSFSWGDLLGVPYRQPEYGYGQPQSPPAIAGAQNQQQSQHYQSLSAASHDAGHQLASAMASMTIGQPPPPQQAPETPQSPQAASWANPHQHPPVSQAAPVSKQHHQRYTHYPPYSAPAPPPSQPAYAQPTPLPPHSSVHQSAPYTAPSTASPHAQFASPPLAGPPPAAVGTCATAAFQPLPASSASATPYYYPAPPSPQPTAGNQPVSAGSTATPATGSKLGDMANSVFGKDTVDSVWKWSKKTASLLGGAVKNAVSGPQWERRPNRDRCPHTEHHQPWSTSPGDQLPASRPGTVPSQEPMALPRRMHIASRA